MKSVFTWIKETFCNNNDVRKTKDGYYDFSNCPFVIMDYQDLTEADVERIRKKLEDIDM